MPRTLECTGCGKSFRKYNTGSFCSGCAKKTQLINLPAVIIQLIIIQLGLFNAGKLVQTNRRCRQAFTLEFFNQMTSSQVQNWSQVLVRCSELFNIPFWKIERTSQGIEAAVAGPQLTFKGNDHHYSQATAFALSESTPEFQFVINQRPISGVHFGCSAVGRRWQISINQEFVWGTKIHINSYFHGDSNSTELKIPAALFNDRLEGMGRDNFRIREGQVYKLSANFQTGNMEVYINGTLLTTAPLDLFKGMHFFVELPGETEIMAL